MLLACFVALPANAGDGILANQWHADFQKAESLSKEHRLPLVIHFHALWCGPCQAMESEVLNTAEVQAALGSGIIGVKVNSDDRPDLVSRFGVTSLPTDVIVSPDGRLLSMHVGSPGRNAYIARLAQFRVPAGSRNRTASEVVALEKAAPMQNAAGLDVLAGTDALAASEKVTVTAMRKVVRRESATSIGLNGYSPVSLTETEEWKTGDAQFSHEFQGVFYQLCSAEELQRFIASPEKFVPAVYGYDPVSLVNDQVFQAGHLELGVTYESKVYFFFSKNTRDEFLSNPEKFSGGQNVSLVSADKKS
ncbi:MAG: thioredoxin domain-containing protein [Planctomycetaceae bacterium]